VLGDVGQPQFVRRSGGEVAFHQVVVNRWSRLPVQIPLLREHRPDAVVPAQALDPVLARRNTLLREFIGDEPVPEGRIVGMDPGRR
jgi:hypothetical protein